MGIYIKGGAVNAIYSNSRPILAIFAKNQKIWPATPDAILSCYANGYWMDQYPWTDNTPWTEN